MAKVQLKVWVEPEQREKLKKLCQLSYQSEGHIVGSLIEWAAKRANLSAWLGPLPASSRPGPDGPSAAAEEPKGV